MNGIRQGWRILRLAGLALSLSLLFTAIASAPARAQHPDPGMIRMELEHTDELLVRAADVVNRTANPMARDQLQFAQQRQDQAWNQFRQSNFLMALQSTRAARDAAARAISMAQQQSSLEQMARRIVEDAGRALENARACAGDSPTEQQRRLLDIAQQQLSQAQENLQAMRWEIADGLARQVLQTARLLCGGAGGGPGGPHGGGMGGGPGGPGGGPGGGFTSCPRVEEMAENVGLLYDRAVQDVPDDDAQARRALEQARDLLDRGRESLRQSLCEPAFAQVRQARDLILRAMRSQDAEPDPATVDRAIDDTAQYLESVAPGIPSDNLAAQALLDNATRHLQRARELRAGGSLRAAFAEARVARNLAWRAARVAGRGL